MKSPLDDRLDLGAQRLDRVAVNARQQPPLAPLELAGRPGVNCPRITNPSVSSAMQRSLDRSATAAPACAPAPARWSARSPAGARAAARAAPRPAPSARSHIPRVSRALACVDCPARTAPGPSAAARPRPRSRRCAAVSSRRPALTHQHCERRCELRTGVATLGVQHPEQHQCIVQLIGASRRRPGLAAHRRDRRRIELSELRGGSPDRASAAPPPPACAAPRAARRPDRHRDVRRRISCASGEGCGRSRVDHLHLAALHRAEQRDQPVDCPSPRAGSRTASGAPADDRESHARRSGFRRTPADRETPPRSGPPPPCAAAARASSCRRASGGRPARWSRSSASA